MRELTDKHHADLDRVAAAVTVSAGLGLETLDDLAAWVEEQAKAGRRAILIDPVSAAVRKGQPWVADPAFVRRVKRAAIDHKCSIIPVTQLADVLEMNELQVHQGWSSGYVPFALCRTVDEAHDACEQMRRHQAAGAELNVNVAVRGGKNE